MHSLALTLPNHTIISSSQSRMLAGEIDEARFFDYMPNKVRWISSFSLCSLSLSFSLLLCSL
jgi:hypothetical protein